MPTYVSMYAYRGMRVRMSESLCVCVCVCARARARMLVAARPGQPAAGSRQYHSTGVICMCCPRKQSHRRIIAECCEHLITKANSGIPFTSTQRAHSSMTQSQHGRAQPSSIMIIVCYFRNILILKMALRVESEGTARSIYPSNLLNL